MRIPSLLLSLITFFSILFSSCGNNPEPPGEEKMNRWFNRMMSHVYVSFDSVYYYAGLIDSNSYGNPVYSAMSDIGYGVYFRNKEFHEQSRRYYSSALEKLKNTTADTLKGRAHAGIGNSYRAQGKFDLATSELLEALRIFEKEKYVDGIVGVNGNLAQLFQEENNLDRARHYLKQGLGTPGVKRNRVYLISMHTLANTYGMSGKLDSARMLSSQGLKLADSLKLPALQSLFYDNTALCMLNSGQYDSSYYFFKKCIVIDSSYGNKKQVADTYLNLGQLAMMQNKMPEAEAYTRDFIRRANSIGYLPGVRNGWKQLGDIYVAGERWREATQARDSLSAVSRKVNDQKSQNKILELEAVFESKKKDDRIAAQQREIVLRNWMMFWISLVSLLVLVIGFILFRRFRDRKNRELSEKAKQAIFETEQQERLRIARDLHDSIGQKLSVVKMQLSSVANAENASLNNTASLVDNTISELRTIAHNLVPDELRFGLITAISDLCHQTNAAGKVEMIFNAPEKNPVTEKTKEITIYRIVQEIVSNMLKHSGATTIRIEMTEQAKQILLLVSDNGKGFDTASVGHSQGMGWRNISARAALLGGEVDIHSDHSGTKITVRFSS